MRRSIDPSCITAGQEPDDRTGGAEAEELAGWFADSLLDAGTGGAIGAGGSDTDDGAVDQAAAVGGVVTAAEEVGPGAFVGVVADSEAVPDVEGAPDPEGTGGAVAPGAVVPVGAGGAVVGARRSCSARKSRLGCSAADPKLRIAIPASIIRRRMSK